MRSIALVRAARPMDSRDPLRARDASSSPLSPATPRPPGAVSRHAVTIHGRGTGPALACGSAARPEGLAW
jgi:hypothetical protein